MSGDVPVIGDIVEAVAETVTSPFEAISSGDFGQLADDLFHPSNTLTSRDDWLGSLARMGETAVASYFAGPVGVAGANTLFSLERGNSIGDSLLSGLQSGAMSYAGGALSSGFGGALEGLDFSGGEAGFGNTLDLSEDFIAQGDFQLGNAEALASEAGQSAVDQAMSEVASNSEIYGSTLYGADNITYGAPLGEVTMEALPEVANIAVPAEAPALSTSLGDFTIEDADKLLASVEAKAAAVRDVPWYSKAAQWAGKQAGFVYENSADPTNAEITGWGYNPINAAAGISGIPGAGVVAKLGQKALGIDPKVTVDFTEGFSSDNLLAVGGTLAGVAGIGALAIGLSGAGDDSKARNTSQTGMSSGPKTKYAPVTVKDLPGFDQFQPINFEQPAQFEMLREMQQKFGSKLAAPQATSLNTQLLSSLWRPLNG